MLNGCDISNFQGRPDFNQVKTQIDFVICKATEGVGYTDPSFSVNLSQLRSFNVLRGYYHFARPDLGNSPEAEAEWFLKVVGTPQAGEILALDFEVNYTDRVNWCRKFLDHLSYLLNGYKPLIYLNLSLVNENDWSSLINENYGLWLALYDNSTLSTATKWPVCAMKQYTSSGSVSGISGKVDLDVFYGDATTFNAYGYKPPIKVDPQPSTLTTDDDHLRGYQVLEDYRKVRLDGPEGNFEGFCRAMVDRDSKYSGLAGQVSTLQGQLDTATKTINDLTQKLADVPEPQTSLNVGNPNHFDDMQPQVVTQTVTKEVPVTFHNFFANFFYKLALQFEK